ncbi:hypothetical protein [Streptomyces yerevanensis]|uniref:hypothetical protein n=1 Tax=Streptomyces yerevanensis TaxID=66378 RepID=UPI0012FF2264|nr:hypothetical protein [Streptomyces yerevanensis]
MAAQLDDGQLALLTAMAGPYLKSGQWPVWHYVEHALDGQGFEARTVLKSLPVVGSPGPGGRSYGLVWYDRNYLADDSCPALTVAAGLHVPQLEHVFGDNFLVVLDYLVGKQLATRPSPEKVEKAFVTSMDLRRNFPGATREFLRALPGILSHEPTLRRGLQEHWGTSSDVWRYELDRELFRFKGVSTLGHYVARVSEILIEERLLNDAELSAAEGTHSVVAQFTPAVTATPASTRPVYVNERLIGEIEQKQSRTSWSLDKLLGLLNELNECYAGDHVYACHALLRAVIDHLPPILGHRSFDQVASNYPWSQTDKKYVKKLLEFKNQGHDVLHRPIRTSEDVITMNDLPLPANLNALLRECADKL